MSELRQAQLPKNWKCKKLGDIASVEYGFTDKAAPEGSYRYVRITDIDKNGELVKTAKMYINSSGDADKFILSDNELLMARTGATFAKVLLYRDDEPSVFASYLIKIKFSENVVNKLYWYFSKSADYWEQANELSSGAAQPHFNGKALKQVVFSYPTSVDEQKQIVAELDKAFAAIDQAKANIEKNLQNAKELFQSKLNEIFCFDKLSNRNCDNQASSKEGGALSLSKGEGWEEKELGDVCENLDSKRIPITKNKRESGEIPYYGASGIVDYVADYIFDEDLLLVSEDGANLLARTYPIAFSVAGKTWVNNHAHVLKFESMPKQRFIEYYLNSIKLDDYVSGMAQPKLNQKMLNSILVPSPTEEVIVETVNQLDRLSEELNSLNQGFQKKLSDLEELKKYVLQKAFAGKLT